MHNNGVVRWGIVWLALSTFPVGAQSLTGDWKTDTSRRSVPLSELVPGGPPKDGIPSIDRPRFIPAKQVDWISPGELVVAVRIAGGMRAYPLQILMWHELVNDQVGGHAILVSYCPLCNSAVVFEREIAGTVLEFGVSGMLRNSDMIMYDRRTESLWQQITGECIAGTYNGDTLKSLPSQMISFDQFMESYPDGVVLSRETGFVRDYGKNPYRRYEFGNRPIMPVKASRATTLRPMEKLVVLKDRGGYRAYPVSRLAQSVVTEDTVDGRHVVLFYSQKGLSPVDAPEMSRSRAAGTVGVFLASRDGRRIRFRRIKEEIEDRETQSRWSITGAAREGTLRGAQLVAVEHGVYFAFAWLAFRPETRIIGESPPDGPGPY